MTSSRILMLKLAKRLKHRAEKYTSYVYRPRPTETLPPPRPCPGDRLDGDWRPQIFFSRYERRSIARAALADSPAACGKTIEYADRTCAGELEIFGHVIDFHKGLEWATDHATGRTWPQAPAARIPIVYAEDNSDIKAPWELARFQFLGHLGRAWMYTGESKYIKRARSLIELFMAGNPLGIGLHWINPMEAAIRAANWIVADSFFSGADEWDGDFRERLKLALYDHGRFIRSHLERDGRGINTNHYTADLAGLFMIGLFLHDVGDGARWLDFALHELDNEIAIQIAPDGMHYENSIGYHRLAFEMFFQTYRLALMNTIDEIGVWGPTLAKMAEFTLGMTMPTGTVPHFGDIDDGLWLAGTPRRADDHHYLVGLSAAAFGRPDPRLIEFPSNEIPEDVYWFMGVDAARTLRERQVGRTPAAVPATGERSDASTANTVTHRHRRHTLSSQVFGSSGMIVLRSNDGYVLVSANPVGTGGIGGHKHNDLLSFVFTVGKNEIIIDPGTYVYTGDPSLRNQLRCTAAHNTVMIDCAEQNRFVSRQLFWVHPDARPRIAHCHLNETLDQLTIEHDGYRRLPGKIIHRRQFSFFKVDNILVVRDELDGTGTHDIRATINFGPGIVTADDPHRVILRPDDGETQAGFLVDEDPCRRVDIEPGWRSVRYREKSPSFRMVQRGQVPLPTSWTTVIGVFDHRVDWPRLEQARDEVGETSTHKFPDITRRIEQMPAGVC